MRRLFQDQDKQQAYDLRVHKAVVVDMLSALARALHHGLSYVMRGRSRFVAASIREEKEEDSQVEPIACQEFSVPWCSPG